MGTDLQGDEISVSMALALMLIAHRRGIWKKVRSLLM
jgi:hypothetical protein